MSYGPCDIQASIPNSMHFVSFTEFLAASFVSGSVTVSRHLWISTSLYGFGLYQELRPCIAWIRLRLITRTLVAILLFFKCRKDGLVSIVTQL
ncbi:hypothetical protein LOAG_12518 [Loa loa]|uniref:Ovule protein n=1 Tax=Loa loa TaxID=7209 RepID=A0A1I7V8T4_LOALO|nr:hypothetical protein LOAG_12518 [Loa loa]EFO15990.1 hypothetical protein LOAG_12518 [Loa loa]